MAKTVFGMPGVDAPKKEGGDAIAPGGVPGAKQKGGLPQKSGKEEIAKKPSPSPAPPAKQEKATPAKPPMAKMAKPVPARSAKSGKGAGPDGGRTVFGMPAVKLPITSDKGKPQAEAPSTDKQAAPEQPKVPSVGPPKPVVKSDDAYGATVLGMAAVVPGEKSSEAAPEAGDESSPQTPEEIPRTEQHEALGAPQETSEETEDAFKQSGDSAMDSYSPRARQSAKMSPVLLILIIVGAVIILGIVAYFIFRSPEEAVSPSTEAPVQGVNPLPPNEAVLPAPVPAAPAQPAVPTKQPQAPNP